MRAAALLLPFLLALPAAGAASVAETVAVPGRQGGGPPFHELNLGQLTPGEELTYSWGTRSAGALTFDVHWHDGTRVVYLVDKEQSTAKSGRLTVPATTNVSFLWENRGTVEITIAYEVSSVEVQGRNILPALPALLPLALAAALLRRRERA